MVKNNEKAHISADALLASVFDEGTFCEFSAYAKRGGKNALVGVVSGYGSVGGRLVFAFVQDRERDKGVFDEAQAKKISSLYSLAIKNGAPVIGIFDSAGASVYDGASALAAYGRLMSCVSDASGIIPQIAIIDGICGGSAAVAASMFDFAVTVKDSGKIFVNPPFNVGTTDSAEALGYSAYEAESRESAINYVRTLISMLPENNASAAITESQDDMARAISLDGEKYDTRELICNLADDGKFVELYKNYTGNATLGFASFGGLVTGLAATNRGSVLDVRSARAITKLQGFCNSFGLPLLTLVDCEGLERSAEAENSSYASVLARLAFSYSASSNAKLTVIHGNAYGAAFTLLGSKALGADMVYALPTAKISVLPPDASVEFVQTDMAGEKSRKELEDEWASTVASAENALDKGEIDDIIAPTELRARICSALSMLNKKSDSAPTRQTAALPL